MFPWIESRFDDLFVLWRTADAVDFLRLAVVVILAGWLVRYWSGN